MLKHLLHYPGGSSGAAALLKAKLQTIGVQLVSPDKKDTLLKALEDERGSCNSPVAVSAGWVLEAALQRWDEGA